MPVIIQAKTYRWLKSIQVFKNESLPSKVPEHCEIPYDQQIYLQNGYLIGVALRKFVTPYSQSYTDLLGVRKIATLKSSQNWQIIQPYLTKIGCDCLFQFRNTKADIQISTTAIAEMLQALYDQFSPKQQQKMALARKIRRNQIDFYNFNINKDLSEAQNSLQFFCIILAKNFQIKLGQALGLLIDRCKYLKKIIIEGTRKQQYEPIKKLYEQITTTWSALEELTSANPSQLYKILQGLSQGVISQSMDIIHATLNLLSFVKQEDWFRKYGYYKLLSSSYIQCFYFTIERLSPHYEYVLNQQFHANIPDKLQLFTILLNIIKILPKTIYCKDVLTHVPISYFYEQSYTVLNQQIIDDQPQNLVIAAKELLSKLMINFTQKIPTNYVVRIIETFKYHGNKSYWDLYHSLALLFDILQAFMHKEYYLTQKLFKLVMKYMSSTYGQIKHWIVQNMRVLYEKLGKSFPLGCLLAMYSSDAIAQPDEYKLFDTIADDNINLTQQQVTYSLIYLSRYVQTQVHCHCFMNIINKLLNNHSKLAVKWGQDTAMQLMAKMQNITIPSLNQPTHVLNPVMPVKNKVVNAIGFKRKEMLKFKQYEQGKQLLQVLLKIKDKPFLYFYANSLSHAIKGIEKEIGHKKKQLVSTYKKIKGKAKKNAQKIKQSQPMSQIVKNIMLSRSVLQQTQREQPNEINYNYSIQNSMLSSSKWKQSESRILNCEHPYNSVIKQQDEQGNQFINSSYINNNNKAGPGNTEHFGNFSSIPVSQQLQHSQNMQEDSNLLIFTQQQSIQPNVIFYSNNILQQNEIQYINIVKQKYKELINYCTDTYTKLQQRFVEVDELLKQFICKIGLQKIIDADVVEELFIKCKMQCGNHVNNKELVEGLLVQIAFHAFGFKKDMRVVVSCVSSLFVLLEDNLKHQMPNKYFLQSKSQANTMKKDIEFQHKLSNRIITNINKYNNKMQVYLTCFSLLNEILNKGCKFEVIQPISTIVSYFPKSVDVEISQTLQSEQQTKSEVNNETQTKQLSELQQLQGVLERMNEKSRDAQLPNLRHKKYKKRIPTEQINLQRVPGPIASKLVDNSELKTKLAARMKVLGDEVTKINNKKNIAKIDKNKANRETKETEGSKLQSQ